MKYQEDEIKDQISLIKTMIDDLANMFFKLEDELFENGSIHTKPSLSGKKYVIRKE